MIKKIQWLELYDKGGDGVEDKTTSVNVNDGATVVMIYMYICCELMYGARFKSLQVIVGVSHVPSVFEGISIGLLSVSLPSLLVPYVGQVTPRCKIQQIISILGPDTSHKNDGGEKLIAY